MSIFGSMGRLLVVLVALFGTHSALGIEFNSAKHLVYKGDVNGDGHDDIYLKRKHDVVIIASSPVIPVTVAVDQSYVMYGAANGFYAAPVLDNSTDVAVLQQQTVGVSFGDFNNDGLNDVVIQGEHTGENSLLLTGTSGTNAPSILEQFSTINGLDISLASATITMQDINGDGYADFMVVWVAGGQSNLANTATGQFAFVSPNVAPAPQIAIAPQPDSESDQVGVVAGSFRVDEQGSATYSIPVLTAPGIAGVVPQISLNYASQGGNGIAGQGWSVGGSSVVTRCRQTLVTDGFNRPVDLTSTDKFCLNGSRLVEVTPTLSLGPNDVEYRTEVDQFSRIIGYGAADGHPSHFEVWGKDGSLSSFGDTADSKFELPGQTAVIAWSQDEFADNMGNAITFEYNELTHGEQQLARITYAGGAASIEFEYEDRPDKRVFFQHGSRMESRERLSRVVSSNDGGELRTYSLAYALGTHNEVSQLQSVTECRGSVCYPSTTFDWSNPAQGVGPTTTFQHSNGYGGGRAADINGDGINELIWMSVDPDSDSFIAMSYRSGSTWAHAPFVNELRGNVAESWTIIDYNNDGLQDVMYQEGTDWKVRLGQNTTIPSLAAEFTVGTAASDPKFSQVADLQGDGLPDIVFFDHGQSPMVQRLLPTGNPASPYAFDTPRQIVGVPIAGGVGEVVVITSMKPLIADFNADGVVDFLFQENRGPEPCIPEPPATCDPPDPNAFQVSWAAYTSTSFNEAVGTSVYSRTLELPGEIDEDYLRASDINGDGLADVAYRLEGNSTWYYRLNNGAGFEPAVSIGVQTGFVSKRLQFMDYDRDGDADLLYPDGTNFWKVREWNVDGFDNAVLTTTYPAKSPSSGSASHWNTTFIDFNGDGKLETVTGDDRDHSGSNNALFTYASNGHVPENVITRITNGFGADTDITYTATTDPSHSSLYTKGTNANTLDWGHPVFDLNAPMWVVRNVSSSAPAAGSTPGSVDHSAVSSVSYRYGEFKIQAGGRGSLGFGWVMSIDNQTQIETRTDYMQAFPFTGRPEATEVLAGGSDRLSYATNSWLDFNDAGPNHQPYLDEAVEQTHSTTTTDTTSGTFSVGGVLSTTTTTTTMHSQYGVYGDVGEVMTQTVSSGETYRKTTTNAYYAPDLADWHHGRLRDVSVEHHRTDNTDANVTRKSYFEYDSVTGLLTKEVVEPGGGQAFELSTTYVHDSFGNVTIATQNGYRGHQLPGDTDDEVVDRTARTFFDTNGRYSTSTENHEGHASTVISRNDYGAVTAAEDAIGNQARTVYGALGRQFWSGDDVGGFSMATHRLCTAVACPTGAIYRIHSESAGGAESMAYFDILGREIRTANRMFDDDWSVTLKEYDKLGRVAHASEPFRSSSPETGSTSYWTSITYDALGRPTHTALPDLSTATVVYNGFTTTSSDPNAKTRIEIKNALGELVRAQDHAGGFVDYIYDEQGNLAVSTQGGPGVTSVTSSMSYDLLGRKESMNDADMGLWSYEYNAFGELIVQTTATGDRSEMAYDRLGRMVQRVDYEQGGTSPVADAMWIYDTAPRFNEAGSVVGAALGLLHIEDQQVGSDTPLRREFSYDAYGRSRSVETQILKDGSYETYIARTTYDEYGRVFQEFDGAEAFSGLEFTYNQYGYLERVDEAANSATITDTYYRVVDMDERGNVAILDKGPLTISRTFDPATGRPTEIYAVNALRQTVQNLDLAWDAVGNLLEKHDQNRTETGSYKNILEAYAYDDLYRLSTVTQDQQQTLAMQYDALGNITSKDSAYSNATVDSYAYTSGTHRLCRVDAGSTCNASDPSSYTYDANGSVLSGGGRTIEWGVHNKPVRISRAGRTVDIDYGPNRSRYQRIDDENASGEVTTHYVSGFEKIWRANGDVDIKRYIAGEAIVTMTDDGGAMTTHTRWLLTDHLGSTELLVDDFGQVIQAMSFDAFGSRRSSVDFAAMSLTTISTFNVTETTRGFTGHEGLDGVGLVHMNGRVYDPLIGRFLSADPFVQAPENTQSHNRYAYVWNNPLSYTDPSGYFVKKLRRNLIRATVKVFGAEVTNFVGTIVASYFGGPLGAAAWSYEFNRALGAPSGVALRSAAIAGVSAWAFGAIGQANWGIEAKALAHGIVGGISSELQGGKFGHGFVSAGFTKLLNVNTLVGIEKNLTPTRIAVAAIVGGTISELTGGKFANGAATAALGQALNGEKQAKRERIAAESKHSKWIWVEVDEAYSVPVTNADGQEITSTRAHVVSFTDYLELMGWSKTAATTIGSKSLRPILDDYVEGSVQKYSGLVLGGELLSAGYGEVEVSTYRLVRHYQKYQRVLVSTKPGAGILDIISRGSFKTEFFLKTEFVQSVRMDYSKTCIATVCLQGGF